MRKSQREIRLVEEIPGRGRVTLGADKGYDRKEFIDAALESNLVEMLEQFMASDRDFR